MRKLLGLTALGLLVSAGVANAADKVVVVTSFPKELTDAFEAAFAASNLDYELEILSKGTSAAVKYIQETAGNNTSDLMWASAPDAFEVLKGNDLGLVRGVGRVTDVVQLQTSNGQLGAWISCTVDPAFGFEKTEQDQMADEGDFVAFF